jgi:DNA-binding YbaB/EbfC family protein
MFKGLADLASVMRQAQQIKGKMEDVNRRLKGERVTASTGGGMIQVEANGLGEVVRVSIEPDLVQNGEREMIEDLLPAAFNQAVEKSKQLQAEAMKSVTDGLNLPGLDQALSQLSNPGGS